MKRARPHSELERLALNWAKAKLRHDEILMGNRGLTRNAKMRASEEAIAQLDLLVTCTRILSQEAPEELSRTNAFGGRISTPAPVSLGRKDLS